MVKIIAKNKMNGHTKNFNIIMRSILEFCRREENLTKSLVLKGSRGATKRASGLSSVPEF